MIRSGLFIFPYNFYENIIIQKFKVWFSTSKIWYLSEPCLKVNLDKIQTVLPLFVHTWTHSVQILEIYVSFGLIYID